MLKKIILRFGVFIFTLALIGSMWTFAETHEQIGLCKQNGKLELSFAETHEQMGLCKQNGKLELSVNEKNGVVSVFNRADGTVWCSNPEDGLNDETAVGISKTNLMSQFVVIYKSTGLTEMTTNSYSECVVKKTVDYKQSSDGITATYRFEKTGFVIPVVYSLKDGIFSVRILLDEIRENGSNRILSIAVLPYFGAASVSDHGYMIVPDGSGAIINFNNGKYNVAPYSKRFYGGDGSIQSTVMMSDSEKLMLPVFGMVKNTEGFLAEISEGAAAAELNASVSGMETSYNNISSSLIYRTFDQIDVRDNAQTTKSVLFTADSPTSLSEYRVDYRFFDAGTADYVKMAKHVGELLENQGMKLQASGTPSLTLKLYGAVQKPASFLGFRYTKTQKLTDLDDVYSIFSEVSGYAECVQMILKQFSYADVQGKAATRYSLISALGNKKKLKELCSLAEKNGSQVSLSYDFMQFSKSGNGYGKFRNAALALDLSTVQIYPYKLNTAMLDDSAAPTYLITADSYKKGVSDICGSIEKYGCQAYFENAGNLIYSDFRKGGCRTEDTAQQVIKALTEISENCRTILSAPNAYALPTASYLTDIPTGSSGWQIFDGDIPFYQIAVRGFVDYSCEEINLGGYTESELLRCAEYGSNLSFAVMESRSDELLNTEEQQLYAACYASLRDTIKEWYERLCPVLKKIGKSAITAHSSDGTLSKTTYANGVCVYVNYSDKQISVDGVTVNAEDFTVTGG